MKGNLRDVFSSSSGAVGSFNVVELGMAEAIVAAAEEAQKPVIIGIATRHWKLIDPRHMMPSLLSLVESASVPIALHLDHASPSQMDIVRDALGIGFTSIMIDGSKLPVNANIEATGEVLALARAYDATVEAELGPLAGEEGIAGLVTGDVDERQLTDPYEAAEFVKAAPVDALAVSVGTAHGLYTSAPRLQLDLIAELNRTVVVPLVLHGATGIPDNVVRSAVKRGVRKINYFSGLLVEAMQEVQAVDRSHQDNDYLGLRRRIMDRWKTDVGSKIQLYAATD